MHAITSSATACCPTCEQTYHYNHLKKWLVNHDDCPICRTSFPFYFMSQIRPKPVKKLSTSETKADYEEVFDKKESELDRTTKHLVLGILGFILFYFFTR